MKVTAALLALLMMSPVFAANTPEPQADAEQAVTKKKLTVAHIEIHGHYPEGAAAPACSVKSSKR